ncbi:MAG: transglutaminase domain-containing protein [Planctomycetota bacterium]
MNRNARSTGLCVVVVAGLLTGSARGQELIKNGGFGSGADGWTNQVEERAVEDTRAEWLADGGRDGGGLHIESKVGGSQPPWIWSYKIEKIAKGKTFRVSGWVKGKNVEVLAAICVQGWDKDKRNMVDFTTTGIVKPMTGNFDWTRIEARMRPDKETTQLVVMAFISGKGEVWFDDVSVIAVEPDETEDLAAWGQRPPLPTPGLFDTRGRSTIAAQRASPKPTFLIPLPMSYREQVPLTYELFTEPAGKLASARVYRDRPNNYVVEAILKPLKRGEEVVLSWRSIVLCAERSFDDVPETAPFPKKWPKKVRCWLESSQCVQASDKRIRKVARKIRGDSDDVLEIIQSTLERTGSIFAKQEGPCSNLDAVQALEKQGSCTSCANLVAALLRANDIPARILAGYATWAGPHQTHYLVEAYVPGYGWYPIESTQLVARWQPYGQVQVSIVRPDYEDRSGSRPLIAGGVPYLSLDEHPGFDGSFVSVGTVDEKHPYCDHVAKLWRKLPMENKAADWGRATERAKAKWNAWLESSPSLNEQQRLATSLLPDAIVAREPGELVKMLAE